MRSASFPIPRQKGFTLVEILVGLAIGLLTTLVIMQVLSTFERQKRTTTGTADAQTNGSIALYMVQRDLRMAGFGLPMFDTENSPMQCTTFVPAGATVSPVSISDGTSDTITIRYGTPAKGGIPVAIFGVVPATPPAVTVGVDNNMGCQVGDIALAVTGATCIFTEVTGPTDIAIPPVPTGDTTHIVLRDVGNHIAVGQSLSCLGRWGTYTYGVNSNQLELNGAPRVTDIVNIQAQYGVSANAASNEVNAWVDATGVTWTNPTVVDRNRIKAVRVAVVARSGQLENSNITSACSSLNSPKPTGLCAWEGTATSPAPAIDLRADPNWQRYRYRVFETIIPLRNMIWSRNAL
ncbi:MAG TPA: PilW family protein [Methylophilaceae bacterium]|nr:PilW family protein [Methylophilaceae bacterium]